MKAPQRQRREIDKNNIAGQSTEMQKCNERERWERGPESGG